MDELHRNFNEINYLKLFELLFTNNKQYSMKQENKNNFFKNFFNFLGKNTELVTNKTSNNQSSVSVNTEFANSLLQLTATKKGAKTIILPVQTNSKGDAKLKVKTNLSGYKVSLKAGSETLDSDKVK